MKRRARFSVERVANAQVRQLEDEARVHESRDLVLSPDEIVWCAGNEPRTVTQADRIRLLYGLRV